MKFQEYVKESLPKINNSIEDEILEFAEELAKSKYNFYADVKFGAESRFGEISLIVMQRNGKNVGSYEFNYDKNGKLDFRVFFNAYDYGSFLGDYKQFAVFDELPKILDNLSKFAKESQKFAKDFEKYLIDFNRSL